MERRPITADDTEALHAILGDPEVSAWLRPAAVTGPITVEECRTWAAQEAAHWAAHDFGSWLMLDGGAPVARGGIHHALPDGRAEVELLWAVARPHWGRGLATSIGRWGLELAAERGITGVVAYTRVDNCASRRVMEKLGLEQEREFPHAGLPHVLYRNNRPNT